MRQTRIKPTRYKVKILFVLHEYERGRDKQMNFLKEIQRGKKKKRN